MNTAVIGLGSNIQPEENIRRARKILAQTFNVQAESQFIQTAPVGYTDQADFINGAVLIQTPLSDKELEAKLKNLEQKLGRTKSNIKSGPRTIDLDIIIWNNTVIDCDFYERDFLKNSVLELIPDLQY